MTPKLGKYDGPALKRVVFRNLGARRKSVITGPGVGLDNAVLAAWGRVMIVTTDPISIVPSVGTKTSAWLSVHLLASDYATSGNLPEYATFSYNFPPEVSETEAEDYIRSMGAECEKLGVAIVAGHTGNYPGARLTVIGAGTLFGYADKDRFVTPAMARAGDAILMTKHCAIEAAAHLAAAFPQTVETRVGRETAEKARKLIGLCSTVEDSAAAASTGIGRDGVTSMHDATEGAVVGALAEMATASGKAFVVNLVEIPVSDEAGAVCKAFGLDALSTLSEGVLLLTCRPNREAEVSAALRNTGVDVRTIGRVQAGSGLWSTQRKRLGREANHDLYWDAFSVSTSRGRK